MAAECRRIQFIVRLNASREPRLSLSSGVNKAEIRLRAVFEPGCVCISLRLAELCIFMPAPTKNRPALMPRRVAPGIAAASQSTAPSSTFGATAAIYGIPIFLGAFLLFQVQLILGKFVLPRFGGGPSVWSTSLLTFQFLLLAGYGYAAFLTRYFSPKVQRRIHLGLLVISALLLAGLIWKWHSPILPLGNAVPSGGSSPVFQIASLLLTSVGFPCVVLSASSPLLQKWFSDQRAGRSPYRLYALSNFGSMLGLLTYPFLVERLLRLSVQAWLWMGLFVLFLTASAVCAFTYREARETAAVISRPSVNTPSLGTRLLWLGLSACGSMMLLATTNLICQEVVVMPLLWVLPLSLYLLSFIVCFDHERWYRREIFHPLYLALALISLRTLPGFFNLSIVWPLAIFSAALLAVCMVCHGELARLKPDPSHLTGFYLMVSAGGALGSAFVVLAAPCLFDRFWEFQIALLGCGLLLAVVLVREQTSWLREWRFGRVIFAAGALALAIVAFVYTDALRKSEGDSNVVVRRERNFFGVKTLLKLDPGLFLVHGGTIHGMQIADPRLHNEPTTYYSRESGIGLLLDNHPIRTLGGPLRVGVVGMGVGTLAAYGRSGDLFRFYEIDPDVAQLSKGDSPTFSFVKESPAQIDIAIGDARIVLQQELTRSGRAKFDVLVVDAFSGDAVPVHLLTREAVSLYLQHLRGRQSVLALHVTSRSIDLRPVVAALAEEFQLASLEIHPLRVGDWILLSRDPSMLAMPALAAAGHPIELTHAPLLWTDDYSNLYPLLRSW